MNIKNILLGSVITLGSIFGTVGAAEARPATCYGGHPSETSSAVSCNHYLPSTGDHVLYVGNTRYEFEIFDTGRATISVNGQAPVPGSWVYHSKGGIQVTNSASGYWFLFQY